MLGYLQKFNNLPSEIRQKVSAGPSMAIIEALEKKYQVALAALIMKVTVKEISLADLAAELLKENLSKAAADQLAAELKEKIFFQLAEYLSPKNFPADSLAREKTEETPPQVKGASFFFSPDDEAEIRELAQKIDKAERGAMSADMVEEKLDTIIERAKINFGSTELAARFRQILKIYLRGIRNRLETKATLAKPFINGGLSFDEDSAEQTMVLADRLIGSSAAGQALKPLPKIKVPEDLLKGAAGDVPSKSLPDRDVPYDFSKKKAQEKIKQDLKKLDTKHELAPLVPAAPAKKISPSAQNKKDIQAAQAVKPAPAAFNQMPLIRRRFEAENLSQSSKRKIEDVKYIPKVMEPLDEIKYMDLISFRRLDRDPAKTAEKIKSKIDLLAEESYAQRLSGIKFWRLSPLNRLYLEIGHLSISENKPVDVIIEERKMRGEDYLSSAEFQAVMDLNKSLRF